MSVVENITKDYGDFQLQVPRWTILDQGVTALVGPSGSGKTSVLRILLGLEKCAGRWLFGGEDLMQLSAPDRRIGVVFQGHELFPHMTAQENIFFAADARGISASESKRRVQHLAEALRMEKFLQRSTHLLSGGEKQRVSLARALVASPRIIFLDEPFSAMDEDLREEARALVARVLRETQVPAVLITHDSRDLQSLAQKVTHIQDGRILSEEASS